MREREVVPEGFAIAVFVLLALAAGAIGVLWLLGQGLMALSPAMRISVLMLTGGLWAGMWWQRIRLRRAGLF